MRLVALLTLVWALLLICLLQVSRPYGPEAIEVDKNAVWVWYRTGHFEKWPYFREKDEKEHFWYCDQWIYTDKSE